MTLQRILDKFTGLNSSAYDVDRYDFDLPSELIAQVPVSKRDRSRLLLVDRETRSFSDYHFYDLPRLLRPGDLLVVNNTRVVPARLFGRKGSGGRAEILVLEHPDTEPQARQVRKCLLKSSKGPKVGTPLFFGSGMSGTITEVLEDGVVRIRFAGSREIDAVLEEDGQMPLPPYIRRKEKDRRSLIDRERYQTIFSERKGAVAAPTAGLHFTDELIVRLERAGIAVASLTLHTGNGTFRPVRTKDIRGHDLGEEPYDIPPDVSALVNETRKNGGRAVAVGTTVVRALETAATTDGIRPGRGETGLLITPGFSFRVVDALITNFHLPRSSLLFLVAAFAGLDCVQQAYRWAIEKRYRFFSYGDAMLIV